MLVLGSINCQQFDVRKAILKYKKSAFRRSLKHNSAENCTQMEENPALPSDMKRLARRDIFVSVSGSEMSLLELSESKVRDICER